GSHFRLLMKLSPNFAMASRDSQHRSAATPITTSRIRRAAARTTPLKIWSPRALPPLVRRPRGSVIPAMRLPPVPAQRSWGEHRLTVDRDLAQLRLVELYDRVGQRRVLEILRVLLSVMDRPPEQVDQ